MALVVAALVTAGFVSRRGKDVTAVTMSKVERMDLTSKVTANGKIDAKRKVDLSANVMWQIVNLAVREGDSVKIRRIHLWRGGSVQPGSIRIVIPPRATRIIFALTRVRSMKSTKSGPGTSKAPADCYDILSPKMPSSPSLSVVILTKNEERHLPALLESLIPLKPDEVLVIDCESTDRTLDIARSWGCMVVVQPWLGFVDQRNLAYRHVTGDWVLFLDADERVTPEMAVETRDAMMRGAMAGYRIPRRNYYLGRPMSCWSPDRIMRLALRERSRWTGGYVHERMAIDGPVGNLRNPMVHDSYRDLEYQHVKHVHYARLMAQTRIERGSRFHWFMLFRPFWGMFKFLVLKGGIFEGRRAWIFAISYTIYAMQKVLFIAEEGLRTEIETSDFPSRAADVPVAKPSWSK